MKNKSALLKIRKNEIFSYLGNPWRKKMCMQKHFLFFIRGIDDINFRKIREKNGIGS